MSINKSNYDKYISNKQMYISLIITQYGGKFDITNNNFYIVHSTTSTDVLLTILKDGYLRPGKDVEHAHIWSAEDLGNIYTNINFDDINNIDTIGGIKLLFHPKIMYDYNIIFNRGWFMYPYESSLFIYDSDSSEDKIKKINDIKKYLINPTFYPKKLIENAGYMAHELLFDSKIPLDKYLIAIVCEECPDKINNKIRRILKTKYPNAKLLDVTRNDIGLVVPPKLADILE